MAKKAAASRSVSLNACWPAPFPRSPAWAGPYERGRTRSWHTSTPAGPATARQKQSTASSKSAGVPHTDTGQQQLPPPHASHRRRPRSLHPHPTLKSRLTIPTLLAHNNRPSSRSRIRSDDGRWAWRMSAIYLMTLYIPRPNSAITRK